MKTLNQMKHVFLFCVLLLPLMGLAQNDFVIEGYVTVDPGNLAKVGHPVTIITDSFSNPAAPYRVKTVFTNANGYYIDTIVDGSLTGPNIKYYIQTLDSCQNVYLRDSAINGQGAIDYARVDFSMDCSSNPSNCAVGFQSFVTGAFGGMKFAPSPVDSSWSYSWDFGDGQSSSLISPEHFYADTGAYYACLTVNDNMGCASTFCDSAFVPSVVDSGCNNVSLDFSFQRGVNGYTVDFNTTPQLSPNNAYYFWDFGDGQSSNLADPSHTYTSNPAPVIFDYEVCVTLVQNNGGVLCFERVCKTVSVPQSVNNNCDAEWTASRTTSGTYAFNPLNASSTASFYWTFGDGDSSVVANPTHTYTASGTYNVCLTLTDSNCTDTYCAQVSAIASGSGSCIDSSVIDSNIVCATVLDPVCGCNGVTYSNSCEAYYWYGVTQWTSGPCGQNNYTLSGLVTKGLNTVSQSAIVYLISADSVNNDIELTLVDSQYTSPQGYYTFNNVTAGEYYLKAALTPNDPDYAGYLPTYYDVSLFWGFATAVNVNSSNNNLNIALVAGNNTGGPGFVSGSISQGAGKVNLGLADAAANIPILLLDMNGNPVQYTYSDASGNFELDDIAYGTYQLYAEVLNKETDPAIITIGPDQESVTGVQLRIEGKQVISSANDLSTTIKQFNLYPNPAQDQLYIDFTLLESAEIELQISDMLGRTLIRKPLGNNISGTQHTSIDVSGLESGMYFLNVRSGDQLIQVNKIFKE